MRNLESILYFFIGLMLMVLFVACGGDDDDGPQLESHYYLGYKSKGEQMAYLEWENSATTTYLRLDVDAGVPKGSEWYLECDASWIKLRNTHGKINPYKDNYYTEQIPFTIEDNTNYEDREANIYLDVPNGYPISTDYTTVTIHQYGLDTHLKWGKSVSFKTNRSKSESTTLTIEGIVVRQVMDIDWGDGSKDYLTKKEYQSTSNLSISHQYNSSGSFNVKLRFAPERDRTSFRFILAKGQGIETVDYYEGGSVSVRIDNTQKVSVTYSDSEGFIVNQY